MLPGLFIGTNTFIAACYFTIAFLIYRDLRQSQQHLLENPLVVATAAIFFSCALGHSAHVLAFLGSGGHHSSTIALAIQVSFDLLTGIVAGTFLALRSQYGVMIHGSVLLSQTQSQLSEANAKLARINTNLESLVAERTAELLQTNKKLTNEITERQRIETALRDQEERFRQLAENIHEVFWMLDLNNQQLLYVSPAYEKLWGQSCESLYKQRSSFIDAIHPDDRDRVLAALEKQIPGEYDEEYRIVRPDGSIRWIRDRAFAIHNEIGQVYRVAGIAEDITYRVEAAQELQRQNVRSQLFAEIALKIRQSWHLEEILQTTVTEVREFLQTDRVIIYRLWEDGSGTVVTEAVDSGWPMILQHNIADNCFPETYLNLYCQGRVRAIADLEQSGLNRCHVEMLQQFAVKANLVVPILQGEKLWGLLIAHQCSSPRQWSEFECELLQQLAVQVGIALAQAQFLAALRDSEEQYHTLAELSPVGIFHTNAEGSCLYVNEKWCAFAGLTPKEALGDGWAVAIHPGDRDRVFREWSQTTKQHLPFRLEYRLQRPDGTTTWVFGQAVAKMGHNGEFAGYIGTITDITERKWAEEEICKALEKEKELSELKSRFVSMTSHEFRTPLSTILSSSELIEHYSHKLPEEKKLTHLHRIQAAVQRMTQLLNDVLIIGKAEAGKLEFNPAPLNLSQFCSELVEELQISDSKQHKIRFVEAKGKKVPLVIRQKSLAKSNGQDITTSLPHPLSPSQEPTVCLDEKLLRHILSNLLSNALKYSPLNSTVDFEVAFQDREVIFKIQDWGIGISPEDQTHVFESFHRGTNVGTIPGTGLGLAIVKKCVDLQGGNIMVNSEVGVGTVFTVRLPLNN